MSTTKAARRKVPTGMPFTLVRPHATALRWLTEIAERATALPTIREDIPADVRADLSTAAKHADLALRAIVGGDAGGAAWAAMQALQAAWCAEVKLGARPAVIGHRKSQAGRSKGGQSKPKPLWHAQCVAHARTLLRELEPHQIVPACVKRFGKSDDAVRELLASKRILKSNRAR